MKIINAVIAILTLTIQSGNASGTTLNITESTQTQFGVGETATDFTLSDMDGNVITLKSMKGKFVVAHFATTWCPFCNAEAPNLEQLFQDYKAKNVQVLLIDVKEPKAMVAQKLRDRFGLTFPILLDSEGTVAASFAPPEVLPDLARDEVMLASNLIIDPTGKIVYMSLLNTTNFDAKLIELKEKLNRMLALHKTTGSINFIEIKNVNPTHVNPGEQSTLTVSFKIKDGYHIQANKVKDNSLVPVELKMYEQDGMAFGEPIFPPWKQLKLAGVEEQLWVFEETVDVTIPVSISRNQRSGDYLIRGKICYQACDSLKCFVPREMEFELMVKIG